MSGYREPAGEDRPCTPGTDKRRVARVTALREVRAWLLVGAGLSFAVSGAIARGTPTPEAWGNAATALSLAIAVRLLVLLLSWAGA